MAVDEKIVMRVRDALAETAGVTEKRMFGGVCFLLNGNMLCGVEKTTLMLRVGKDAYEETLSLPHCRVMDFTGKPFVGYVNVDPDGFSDKRSLKRWLARAESFVAALPPKAKKPSSRLKKKRV